MSSVGEHDPAAGDVVDVLTAEHAKLQRLLDEVHPDHVALDHVTQTAEAVREHLKTMDDVLLPLLARLPAEDRARLGEDLRQVMG